MTHSSFLAPLSEELGILHCHGADAEKFLQGQHQEPWRKEHARPQGDTAGATVRVVQPECSCRVQGQAARQALHLRPTPGAEQHTHYGYQREAEQAPAPVVNEGQGGRQGNQHTR